jgi:hypothetical protein
MTDELFLRKAVIGGETSPHDYVVIWDELPIGEDLKSSVSYEQIREARRLAADRSRPWQR